MSTLTEVCAGLPLDPLPPPRPRDPTLAHAPVRVPQLSSEEKKVIVQIIRVGNYYSSMLLYSLVNYQKIVKEPPL